MFEICLEADIAEANKEFASLAALITAGRVSTILHFSDRISKLFIP